MRWSKRLRKMVGLMKKKVVLETLTSMKRAGADLIMTYHAKDAARWLEEK